MKTPRISVKIDRFNYLSEKGNFTKKLLFYSASGLAIGMTLLLWDIGRGLFSANGMALNLISGTGISFFCLGADYLWRLTISDMFSGSRYAGLTRIPFWYMAGGMCYTIIILIFIKYGWIDLSGIPVEDRFRHGGLAGAFSQIILHFLILRTR